MNRVSSRPGEACLAPTTSRHGHIADLVIIGGGIAGSSLAAVMAEAGFAVVVVEREARFRDRVRGEAIHPWGAAEAEHAGLLDVVLAAGGRQLPVWQRYTDRVPDEPYCWASDFPGSHGEISVSHPALQEAMLAEAAARGATILRPARAIRGHQDGGPAIEVEVGQETISIRARLIVGADGQRSAVRRWLGAGTERDPIHHTLGGGLFEGLRLAGDTAHQAYFAGGFVMLFPQHRNRTRVYLVCGTEEAAAMSGPQAAAAFASRCAAALPDGFFAEWRSVGPTAFFPNADSWATRLAGDGLVLIGDAAGANDPSQGHGLSLIFRDVRELRDLLLDGDDWGTAIAEFGRRRAAYHAVLRAHAQWAGALAVETGPEADARRERVARAREVDPTAGGFAAIYARGPDGLVVDAAARRQFLGE